VMLLREASGESVVIVHKIGRFWNLLLDCAE
jgi:hypothetical protein